MHPLLKYCSGERRLLLGNEAVVRGLLEAGCGVAAAYPGTPSSEIGNNLFFIAQEEDSPIYFEFSTNEKVAMEVAAAAAASGVRSFTCMKHVGMNVASDVMMTLAYIGVKGGMVIFVADDPSMHSSQNEQDSRIFARFANLPMLEPSSPQEMKDMTIEAFEISEALELPVIVRSTTRTSHVSGPVIMGDRCQDVKRRGRFQKELFRWVPVPAVARQRHKWLLEQVDRAEDMAVSSGFNRVEGNGPRAILCSGVSVSHVRDAVNDLGVHDRVRLVVMGFPLPFPKRFVMDALEGVEKVLVVEELEPVMEEQLRLMLDDAEMDLPVFGKASGDLPRLYEFQPTDVARVVAKFTDEDFSEPVLPDLSGMPDLPMRPPTMCKGCPHRETYNNVKEALKQLGIEENTIYPSDIGCYTLALLPPIKMADYLTCMGSSVGTSAGFSAATDQKVVSFIGDSTFFHSGLSPLASAVHNKHNFCLVILDNSTTAMTGQQPHPGIWLKPPGFDKPTISIEDVVKAMGVKNFVRINPYKKQEAVAALKEILSMDGVCVVLSEAPCVLYKKRVSGGRKK